MSFKFINLDNNMNYDFIDYNRVITIITKFKLKNIKFKVLPNIIKNNFLFNCLDLISVSFENCNNVISIGDNFMAGCASLTNPNFLGLNNLQSIGDAFMAGCNSLENPKFLGLNNLQSIGNFFMTGCKSLTNPNFEGLNNLQSIGDGFMAGCRSLQNPNFNGLLNIKIIGEGAMHNCPYITNKQIQELYNINNNYDTIDFTDIEQINTIKLPVDFKMRSVDSININSIIYQTKCIQKLEKLNELDLSNNEIKEPQGLKYWVNLSTLDLNLSDNNINLSDRQIASCIYMYLNTCNKFSI